MHPDSHVEAGVVELDGSDDEIEAAGGIFARQTQVRIVRTRNVFVSVVVADETAVVRQQFLPFHPYVRLRSMKCERSFGENNLGYILLDIKTM